MIKCNLIVMILVLASCRSVATLPDQRTITSLVSEKLGENAVMQKNKDSSFALYTKSNPATLSVSYLIVKLNDLSLVEEGTTSQASFVWIDTYKIEIREISGIIRKLDQPIKNKIIDVSKYLSKL